MKKRIIFLLLIIVLFTILIKHQFPQIPIVNKALPLIPTITPTPTPFIFTSYTAPHIANKPYYTIAMLGDSMTAALGPHGGGLSEYMNTLYPKNAQGGQRILIDNYAKSSNILAVNDQLTKEAVIGNYTFGPLLSGNYDLVLVESYGYNPLSQFGIEEGIKQQNLALDTLMATFITTHPNTAIIFVATIAPNRENYAAATQTNNSAVQRTQQADERIAYIKNHIAYAKSHNIPLINIYQDSLTPNGDGNMTYINPTDDIHPSFAGINFIGHEIGDYIYNNKILPQ